MPDSTLTPSWRSGSEILSSTTLITWLIPQQPLSMGCFKSHLINVTKTHFGSHHLGNSKGLGPLDQEPKEDQMQISCYKLGYLSLLSSSSSSSKVETVGHNLRERWGQSQNSTVVLGRSFSPGKSFQGSESRDPHLYILTRVPASFSSSHISILLYCTLLLFPVQNTR